MLADLEAALRQGFTPENLAVYADYLEQHGDPRGELISLELRHAAAPSPDLGKTIERRIAGMLGEVHDRLQHSTFRFGFIEELQLNDAWHGSPSDVLVRIVRSPLGPFIRAIRLRGGTSFMKYALAAVASVPHYDWLHRLTIRHDTLAVPPKSPPATRAVTAALIRATPRLETLEINGQNMFGTFDHPNVTTWELSHPTSIKKPMTPRG